MKRSGTWTKGTNYLRDLVAKRYIPLGTFIASIERESAHASVHVSGTTILLTSVPDKTPSLLLHNLKHNQVLHEQVVV